MKIYSKFTKAFFHERLQKKLDPEFINKLNDVHQKTLFTGFGAGLFFAFALFRFPPHSFLSFIRTLLFGFIGLGISQFRYVFKARSALDYSEKTQPLYPDEKAAFEYGKASQMWLPYFKSYFNLNAYRHPRAFAAGLKNAEDLSLIKEVIQSHPSKQR